MCSNAFRPSAFEVVLPFVSIVSSQRLRRIQEKLLTPRRSAATHDLKETHRETQRERQKERRKRKTEIEI